MQVHPLQPFDCTWSHRKKPNWAQWCGKTFAYNIIRTSTCFIVNRHKKQSCDLKSLCFDKLLKKNCAMTTVCKSPSLRKRGSWFCLMCSQTFMNWCVNLTASKTSPQKPNTQMQLQIKILFYPSVVIIRLFWNAVFTDLCAFKNQSSISSIKVTRGCVGVTALKSSLKIKQNV